MKTCFVRKSPIEVYIMYVKIALSVQKKAKIWLSNVHVVFRYTNEVILSSINILFFARPECEPFRVHDVKFLFISSLRPARACMDIACLLFKMSICHLIICNVIMYKLHVLYKGEK